MRLRKVKNAHQILADCPYVINEPSKYKGQWNTLFKNNNPIHIEIGMGKGKFILDNALRYPNINFIGIEKYDSVLSKAVKKIDSKINNLYFVCIDALSINTIFEKEIKRIYLNFSDPWPKEKHAKRRLTSDSFLLKYEDLFNDEKEIYMKTDNRQLFEYSLVSLTESNYKFNEISLDLHHKKANVITTEYEEKFIKQGKNIYYLKAYKQKM